MKLVVRTPFFLIPLATASLIFGCSPDAGGNAGNESDPTAETDKAPPEEELDPQADTGEEDLTEATGVEDPVDPIEPTPVCDPGTVTCQDGVVVACKGDGLAWYDVESCDAGMVCNPDTASCTTECVPACNGKQCGANGCGGTCGECEGGALCNKYGQCGSQDMCVAAGTGIQVGSQIKNVLWKDTAGNPVELHQYCGMKSAVLMMETAGW